MNRFFSSLAKYFATTVVIVTTFTGLGVQVANAHPLAPALLQIEQQDATSWAVLWRHSRLLNSSVPPEPVLPSTCKRSTPVSLVEEPGAAVAARWKIQCESDGLAGSRIAVTGLERNRINVIVRLRDRHDGEYQTLLDASASEFRVPDLREQSSVWQRYLQLGAEHLLFGPDHLLFLVALMLLVPARLPLLATLTAFTLGHSVTLSLAALGVIHMPAALMELGIAISLVVVARELLSKTPSVIGRHPGAMSFSFGLLHGLGFAGALAGIGLPKSEVVPALLSFNIGIELGQILVVMLVFAVASAAKFLFRSRDILEIKKLAGTIPGYFPVYLPAYLIGSFAALWCLQRLSIVLGLNA